MQFEDYVNEKKKLQDELLVGKITEEQYQHQLLFLKFELNSHYGTLITTNSVYGKFAKFVPRGTPEK